MRRGEFLKLSENLLTYFSDSSVAALSFCWFCYLYSQLLSRIPFLQHSWRLVPGFGILYFRLRAKIKLWHESFWSTHADITSFLRVITEGHLIVNMPMVENSNHKQTVLLCGKEIFWYIKWDCFLIKRESYTSVFRTGCDEQKYGLYILVTYWKGLSVR